MSGLGCNSPGRLGDVRGLGEPWMVEADRLLEDEELVEAVFEAQGQRHPS